MFCYSRAKAWNGHIAPDYLRPNGSGSEVFYNDGMGAFILIEHAIEMDEGNDKTNY